MPSVIGIGIAVPCAIVAAAAAVWFHWGKRIKERRRKTMLPAYQDCLREARPPEYSRSDPGSDGEPLQRARSPPPDYTASVENLPAGSEGRVQRAPERESDSPDPRHVSYPMQELDRSAVDNLRRGREEAELERGRTLT